MFPASQILSLASPFGPPAKLPREEEKEGGIDPNLSSGGDATVDTQGLQLESSVKFCVRKLLSLE